MRVLSGFAVIAFVSGASALSRLTESSRRTAHTGPTKPPPTKPPPKRVAPSNPDRAYIFQHERFDETDMPVTAYGYPYKTKPPDVVAAEEQARVLKQLGLEMKAAKEDEKLAQTITDKEAAVRKRVRDLHAAQEDHRAKARALKSVVKAAAVKMDLEGMLQAPLNAPVDWVREETPEDGQAPWPPEEDEEAVPTAASIETKAANSSPSAAELRPAVQVKAQEPRLEALAKRNSFYLEKCRQIFAGLDLDGNGAIEEEEILAFFDAAWHDYDPVELMKKFLVEADQDHNGQVTTAEWDRFSDAARKSSRGRTTSLDPLLHLKMGVSSRADTKNSTDELEVYYRRITTRLFQVMDANGNEIASKAEMRAFLDKKYPTRDPTELSEQVLAKADKDGDSNVTKSEFLNFAAGSREMSTNPQEKWNPLLHIISTVRRYPAFGTSSIG